MIRRKKFELSEQLTLYHQQCCFQKAVWLELEETVIKPFFDRYEKFLTDNSTGYLVGNQVQYVLNKFYKKCHQFYN